MAAGLGFKDFTTGEVLTAADVDGYLMQGVWVFASAAARDAAVTSPQEGNFAYLKDTNVTTYYTGSAWANLDTTGMTNPMTTTGDMIYSSSGSTPARLGIGTAGQVLKVNSGATAPEWGAAGGASGLTLIQRSSFSNVANTSTTFDGVFTSTYTNYMIVFEKFSAATLADDLQIQFRYSGVTDTAYYAGLKQAPVDSATWTNTYSGAAGAACPLATDSNSTNPFTGVLYARIDTSGNNYVLFYGEGYEIYNSEICLFHGSSDALRVYTGFILKSASSNVSGVVNVYGLANS